MTNRVPTLFLACWMAILSAIGTPLRAGFVVARDGTRTEGSVQFEGDGVIVSSAQGRKTIPLDQVREATFDPPVAFPPTVAPGAQGLLGEYFADTTLSRMMFVRPDGEPSFDWADAPPHVWLPWEFSTRWTGTITPRYTEPHTFTVYSDGGVRLWIDGNLVLDHWTNKAGDRLRGNVNLVAGKKHDVRIEWFNPRGKARFTLYWESKTQRRQIVPAECLAPATHTLHESIQTDAMNRFSVKLPSGDGGGDLLRVVESRAGTGVLAEYFADKEMEKPRFKRIDRGIDFVYTPDAPEPLVGPTFSVRWTGRIKAMHAGVYTFHITAEDGHRFLFDGRLLSDRWFHMATGFDTQVRVELEAGKSYDFQLDAYQGDGKGRASLSWSSERHAYQTVPAEAFSLPAEMEAVVPPVVALVDPVEGRTEVAPETWALTARAAGEVKSVRFYDRTELVGEVTSPPYRVAWTNPKVGEHHLTAVAVNRSGLSSTSDPVHVTVAGNGRGSFPPGWAEQTFGRKEDLPAMTAKFDAGSFFLGAAGGNLVYHDNDACPFIYQVLDGDGEIVARLSKIDPEDDAVSTFAGVMLRQGFAPDHPQVSLIYTLENAFFSRRQRTGAATQSLDKPARLPCWMRIMRSGTTVRAYLSEDGRQWKMVGAERVNLPERVYVGLVVSTRNRDEIATAVFDHVEVKPGPAKLAAPARGIVTRAGSFLAGDAHSIDQGKLRFKHQGKTIYFPADAVARIAYRAILEETIDQLPANQPGVLMSDDDFLQGEVRSLTPGRVALDSLIFGRKNVDLNDRVAGVELNALKEATGARVTVESADGSVVRARSVSTRGESVVADEPAVGEVLLPTSDVRRIVREP